MTDFLDALEHELTAAARRRPGAGARRGWSQDVRAIGHGAFMAMSLVAVAAVVTMVAVIGHRRVAVPRSGGSSAAAVVGRAHPRTPCDPARPVVGGGARGALVSWLVGTAPATPAQRATAIRDLDQTAASATVLYVDSVRAVVVPRVGWVLLVPARSCAGQVVLAEVPTRAGPATISLGAPGAIRSGAAFASRWLMVRTADGLRFVSGVPDRVVRVVCTVRGGRRSFTVVGHLVALPQSAGDCDLVRRGGASGASI